MTGPVRSNPSWGRLILTAVVSAICTGAIVAAVCVWAFTPRPQIPTSKDGELPPPLAPPSSSGAMWASDEGQGSALDSSSPLPLKEAAPSGSRQGCLHYSGVGEMRMKTNVFFLQGGTFFAWGSICRFKALRQSWPRHPGKVGFLIESIHPSILKP